MRRNCVDRMRKYIHARGYCERCGKTSGPFECAHIVRCGHAWTRTDERNAWCLCHDCHRTVDTTKTEFMALVDKTIGRDLLEELEKKSQRGFRGPNGEPGEKFDWQAELDRWKAMA